MPPEHTPDTDSADHVPSHLLDLKEAAWAAEQRLDFASAETLYRRLLSEAPGWPAAHMSAASFYFHTGSDAEAETLLRRALNGSPDGAPWEPHMRWMLTMALLAAGKDTRSAWQGMTWRFAAAGLESPDLPCPEWKGEPLRGRRLFIVKEQGLGDEIQFARFAPALRDRGTRVVLTCHPSLEELFRSTGVEVQAAADDYDLFEMMAPDDRWVLAFDIPDRAGFKIKTLPRAPYLRPPAQSPMPGRSVGVVTRGNPGHWNDAQRSLPPELARRLLDIPGAVSLDPEVTGATTFAETAAIVACLDLVITVDTSVAHLAGAMGKPVWILLPAYGTDWRWMRERNDTPWYPSARLYRQPHAGDWTATIDRIERDAKTLRMAA